ncbi:MAG: catalase [Balneolaceae bacterium]
MEDKNKSRETKKKKELEPDTSDGKDRRLTTNQGVRVNDNQNSLKAGERGPTLMEDFIFREKMTHFDHERIPERVVHARGSGAHGYFQLYEPLDKYTKADFLNDTTERTPVFVRFSTVVGSRGSTDLARDVRGFSTKFYTKEGNYDLVANNIPVFFIQDAVKFPDLVHAIKPEPDNEIPQATAAHDTFWDFISLMPESMHMIMWVMSDRAIPRSFRMMEGFGVHTFRLINEDGKAHFVKFHWKPMLGLHSVVWNEAQKISGMDPDFLRRDLWDAIESGMFPEWELGMQIVPEEDEHKFDFDLLDATKIIPEELVPVQRVGKMTLNRNPDNFFAETEQVAFHPGHVVPGIDFTNDPLLQGRLFSYTDTQLIRLGGPNFAEIPINRPIAPVHNNQRDGFMRQTINKGKSSYDPNTTGGGCPFQTKMSEGGFSSHAEHIDAKKIRARSRSFFDHFSQATLFYNSQSEAEKDHIASALKFELGKVNEVVIRKRMVGLLTQVDMNLAENVAEGLGIPVPDEPEKPMNRSIPADGDQEDFQPVKVEQAVEKSAALSMENTVKDSIKTRKIAVLASKGFDADALMQMKEALEDEGAQIMLVSSTNGMIESSSGKTIPADKSFLTTASVLFDAVYIPPGEMSVSALIKSPEAVHFVNEAYRHCKPIAADGEGIDLLQASYVGNHISLNADDKEQKEESSSIGVVINGSADEFIHAIAQHRFWIRQSHNVPA